MRKYSGQSIIEYSAIAALVIIGVIVMGPHVIRSINSYFKFAEQQANDSFDEQIRQAPLRADEKYYDVGPDCNCQLGGFSCGDGTHCLLRDEMRKKECVPASCFAELQAAGVTLYQCFSERGYTEKNRMAFSDGQCFPSCNLSGGDISTCPIWEVGTPAADVFNNCGYECCDEETRVVPVICGGESNLVGKSLWKRACGPGPNVEEQYFWRTDPDAFCGKCGDKHSAAEWCDPINYNTNWNNLSLPISDGHIEYVLGLENAANNTIVGCENKVEAACNKNDPDYDLCRQIVLRCVAYCDADKHYKPTSDGLSCECDEVNREVDPNSGSCVCKNGYEESAEGVCIKLCGNGKLDSGEQCDASITSDQCMACSTPGPPSCQERYPRPCCSDVSCKAVKTECCGPLPANAVWNNPAVTCIWFECTGQWDRTMRTCTQWNKVWGMAMYSIEPTEYWNPSWGMGAGWKPGHACYFHCKPGYSYDNATGQCVCTNPDPANPGACICDAGWVYDPVAGSCVTDCGDGMRVGEEACDDGNPSISQCINDGDTCCSDSAAWWGGGCVLLKKNFCPGTLPDYASWWGGELSGGSSIYWSRKVSNKSNWQDVAKYNNPTDSNDYWNGNYYPVNDTSYGYEPSISVGRPCKWYCNQGYSYDLSNDMCVPK